MLSSSAKSYESINPIHWALQCHVTLAEPLAGFGKADPGIGEMFIGDGSPQCVPGTRLRQGLCGKKSPEADDLYLKKRVAKCRVPLRPVIG